MEKGIWKKVLMLLLLLAVVFPAGVMAAGEESEQVIGVQYRGHVENKGDMPKPEGTMIEGPMALGTRGQGLRVEGFWIELTGQVPEGASINYQVHVQNKGWMDSVSDGAFAGTEGQGLRVESIKIWMEELPGYEVYYRGHVQNVGDIPQVDSSWDWVKDGQELGTTGSSLRLEELQVKIGADLTEYQALLAQCAELNEEDYTTYSWNHLQTALSENKMTMDNTPEQVSQAVANIQEALSLMENMTTSIVYDVAATYGPELGLDTIDQDIIVMADGITLQNLILTGNLIITEDVGDGDVTLNNITVEGQTRIRGGGINSIHINGGQYRNLVVQKLANGIVRVVTTDVYGEDGLPLVIAEDAINDTVIIEGEFDSVEINAPGAKVVTQGNTSVGQMTVTQKAQGAEVTVAAGTTVGQLNVEGDNTQIKGEGTVKNADVDGDGAVFETRPETWTEDDDLDVPPEIPDEPTTGGGVSRYEAAVNVTIDGSAADATSVALGTSATDASPVAMTSGGSGDYMLASQSGTKYIFVNSKYTGLTLNNATAKDVAMFTVNYTALAGSGTSGSGGTVSAAYAADNGVSQVQNDAISNGDLVVTGSKVTFSIAKTEASDALVWSGTTFSDATQASQSLTYTTAVTGPIACTTADGMGPTAGNSGTISTASVDITSLTLNWTKATDNKTAQAALKYYVYQSESNNLGSVSDCETNGTLLNSGGTEDIATYDVSGLSGATGYYFNVVVVDQLNNKTAYTTVNQTTLTDTTEPTAGNSGIISTASVAATSLTLNWTKATDNASAQTALKYYVYQSASDNLSTVTDCTTNGTLLNSGGTADVATYGVTGLTELTTYYFNVVVEDEAGNKTVYTTVNETTPDGTGPTAGNSGSITTASVDITSLTLNWTKATDNASAQTALKYYVYQSLSDNLTTVADCGTNGTLLNSSGTADIATYDVSGLAGDTAYYFNVVVEDEAGNKTVYVTVNETTLADTTGPTAGNSGSIATASVTATSLTLNWTKATDNASAQSALKYYVYQSASDNLTTVADCTNNGTLLNSGGTTDIASYDVAGLSELTTYYFNVVVEDEAGNKTAYTKVNATTPDGTGPTAGNSGTITTASVGMTSLTLNWTIATDNVSVQSALKYYVYQSASDNLTTVSNCSTNGTLLNSGGTVNIATKSVSGLIADTTYYFNVVVEDEAGNKTAYTTVSQTTLPDLVAPTAGNSGTITTANISGTGMTLNWTKASDNASAQSALKYYVYQSDNNNLTTAAECANNGTLLNSGVGETTDIATYNVTGLTDETTYYFNLVVEDEAGNKTAYSVVSEKAVAPKVTLAEGSWGTAGNMSISYPQGYYIINEVGTDNWRYFSGIFGWQTTNLDFAIQYGRDFTTSSCTGLDNEKTYNVFKIVPGASSVTPIYITNNTAINVENTVDKQPIQSNVTDTSLSVIVYAGVTETNNQSTESYGPVALASQTFGNYNFYFNSTTNPGGAVTVTAVGAERHVTINANKMAFSTEITVGTP